jgi:hypothetical protein
MQPNEPAGPDTVVNPEIVRTGSTNADAADQPTLINACPPETAAGPVPTQILRFRILRPLGSGGFGCVYLAYDPTLDREIALKVPRESAGWADDQTQKFLEEARIAARLKHPHVIAIYDAGRTEDGGVFIAMENVAGESLAERLKRGKLSVPETVRILGQVADAMRHAHKLNLLHRDLKPSNILLDHSGNAKVCDFGLALHEDAQHDHRGEISGTLAYMSPEQIDGNSHLLDGRSDIWSLGVILYECLSGRRPFRGGDWQQTREEILTRDPKPLRQLDDSIPEALDDLCRKCFRRNVPDRLPTAQDFRQALTGTERENGPAKRRLTLAAMGAVLFCAALAAGGGWYFFGNPQPAAEHGDGAGDGRPATPATGPADRTTRDLLAQEPRPVVFEASDPQSVVTYSGPFRRLTVGSLYWAAFACGEQLRDMRLNVSTTHGPEPATAGVFWGLHPEVQSGGVAQQSCVGVVVEPAEDSSQPATVRFYRLVIANSHSGSPAIESTHEIANAPVAVRWKAPVDLQLHVTAGKLVALTVQGTALDLPPRFNADWAAYSEGECGLLAAQSVHHVVFTQAVLQPLLKE